MGVAAGGGAERAERRGDGVAAALDGELDDLGRVEVVRVLGERGAGRVLDALVDGQDRHVAGAGQAAVRRRASGASAAPASGRSESSDDPVDEVRPGKVQALASGWSCRCGREQRFRIVTEDRLDRRRDRTRRRLPCGAPFCAATPGAYVGSGAPGPAAREPPGPAPRWFQPRSVGLEGAAAKDALVSDSAGDAAGVERLEQRLRELARDAEPVAELGQRDAAAGCRELDDRGLRGGEGVWT